MTSTTRKAEAKKRAAKRYVRKHELDIRLHALARLFAVPKSPAGRKK